MSKSKENKPFSKANKALQKLRVDEIYGMLSRGYSRTQILQECSSWNLCDRQIDTLTQRARDLLEKDCDMARPAYLAELLQRLRTYEQAAAKRGQYQVAVNAATTQAKLTGMEV